MNPYYSYSPFPYYNFYWQYPQYQYHQNIQIQNTNLHPTFDVSQQQQYPQTQPNQSGININQTLETKNYVEVMPKLETISLERMKTQNNISSLEIGDEQNLKKKFKKQRGHWSNEEHYKFLQFVRLHRELFQTSVHKKLNRVFKMMAEEIQTRNACQCRSHFSKFNPFVENSIIRRKLCNDEQHYEKIFNDLNKLDVQ